VSSSSNDTAAGTRRCCTGAAGLRASRFSSSLAIHAALEPRHRCVSALEKKFGEKVMNCGGNLTTREGVEGGASCYLLTGRPRLYLACLALAAASSAARELPLSALRSSPDTLRAPPPSAICEQKWA
jgi:hypothetical protein